MSYPSLEETRDVELVEGVHLYIDWKGIICCRWCGLCRSSNPRIRGKPCRGIVRIKLR